MKKVLSSILSLVLLLGTFLIFPMSVYADDANFPILVSAESFSDGVEITWEKMDDVNNYKVFKMEEDGCWRGLGITNENVFKDKENLKKNTTYIYTVRGMNDEETKYITNFDHNGIEVTTIEETNVPNELDMPQIKSLRCVKDGIEISWDQVDGASLYGVYRQEGSSWKRISTQTGTKYVDKKSDKNPKDYVYTLRCISKNGKKFESYYNRNGFKIKWIPVVNVNSITNLDSGQRIKWDAIDGIESYIFYVSFNGKNYERLGVTDKTQYDYKDVQTGKKYTYTVIPCDKNGEKLNTGYVGKSSIFYTYPKISSVTNGGGNQKITFEKVSGVKYYRVYVETSDGWKRITTTTNNYVYNENVKNKTTYRYTVRGIDGNGNFITDYNSFASKEYKEPENSGNFLISLGSSYVDKKYKGRTYSLTSTERQILENIVDGEFGGDYKGSVLIAQCLRDAVTYGYTRSIATLPIDMGYYGYSSARTNTSSNAKKAVSYVFDQGGSAVQHRILVMYNPTMCYSSWHESQEFVYSYAGYWGSVRFFDMY